MSEKLPVFATVGETFRCLRHHGRRMAPYVVTLVIINGAIFGMLIMLGLTSIVLGGQPSFDLQHPPVGQLLGLAVVEIGLLAAILPIMTSFQRLVVQGGGARVGFGYGREEWLSIGAFFRIMPRVVLGYFLVAIPTALVGVGLAMAVKLPWLMMPIMIIGICGVLMPYYSRLSLVGAAAAQGIKLLVRDSLKMGKGNGWRLVAVFLLSYLPFCVPGYAIYYVTHPIFSVFSGQAVWMPALVPLPIWGILLSTLFAWAIQIAGLFSMFGALALAYRHLSLTDEHALSNTPEEGALPDPVI